MSASDILANMSRGWNRDPKSVAFGTERNGVSAALWTHVADDVQEVWAEPDETFHNVSLVLRPFHAEVQHDGRAVTSKRVSAGDVNIVQAGERPTAIHRGPWSVLHFFVPKALLAGIASAGGASRSCLELINPSCSRDDMIERIGRDVLVEMKCGQPLSRLRIDVLGQDLVIQLLRRWSNIAGTPALARELSRGGLAPWQVKRATEFMEDRLADDVSLDDLSKLLGLSSFHLCRAFKQSVGEPPHRWRQQRRMERARGMLAGTDLPVIEVAAAVGYDDPSRFATAFRKAFGVNPSTYRRERLR